MATIKVSGASDDIISLDDEALALLRRISA